MRSKLLFLASLAMLSVSIGSAATFGRVVPIGGHAADLALDEARGALYIANYTGSRIDVMSLADNTVARSITVAAYPAGVALSPDGRYLIVTHFGNFADPSTSPTGVSNVTPPLNRSANTLTVIDLNDGTRRSFGLSDAPMGVAFGIDGRALILTAAQFLLFDPASGATQVVGTVLDLKAEALPVKQGTFPPQIIKGSVTATPDRTHIFGFADEIMFSYNAVLRRLEMRSYSASPTLGPRAITVSADSSYYMAGWGLFNCGPSGLGDCGAGRTSMLVAQIPNASGVLNVGTTAIRSSTGTIYAQVPPNGPTPPVPASTTVCLPDGRCITVTDGTPATTTATASNVPPALLVMDADNLTVRERIEIPENLAGKSLFNSDETVLYSISDSGVMVLPMRDLERAPRVAVSQPDVIFRGSFCDRRTITQEIDVADPNGARVAFQFCSAQGSATGCEAIPGVTFFPQSGVTPAHVRITVDPALIQNAKSTNALQFEVRAAGAVNMPAPPVRGIVETYRPNVRARLRVLVNNREPDYRGSFFNIPGILVDLLADPGRDRFYILRQDTNEVLVYDGSTYNLIAKLRTSNTPTQMAITFDRRYLMVGHNDSQLAYVYDLDTLTPSQPIRFPFGHYPRSIAASGNAILASIRSADSGKHKIDRVDFTSRTATELETLGPYTNDVHVSTVLSAAPNGGTIFAAMPDGRVLLYNASTDSFAISRKDFTALKGTYAASSYGFYVVDQHLLNESLVRVGSLTSGADVLAGFAFVDQASVQSIASGGTGQLRRRTVPLMEGPLPTRIVESPLDNSADKDYPFLRTLAPLTNRSGLVSLTTSGFTLVPWNYDVSQAPPQLDRVVNSADLTKPIAPGGLISVMGRNLSPISLSASGTPLPTTLGESCLAVNGVVIPMVFASPTQINAQLPFQVEGNATMVLRTPGGASDALNISVQPAAPSVFRSGTAGPLTGIPMVIREKNSDLVTVSNPVHLEDRITIYLTGMGRTLPAVETGAAAPADPPAAPVIPVTVTLGAVDLAVGYAGLAPGQVGVYQINAAVPFKGVPTGFDIPLTISQGGASTTLLVRVVD